MGIEAAIGLNVLNRTLNRDLHGRYRGCRIGVSESTNR